MKSSTFSLLFLFFASILILPGCKQEVPKIGILFHSFQNPRWVKDKQYLIENLTQMGAEVLTEVADNDQKKQIAQAQDMIDKGVKVLIVIAVKQDEAADIVELAHKKAVKVIAYDRMMNNCPLDYYITVNSTYTGKLQASYLTSLQPQGKYALIPGSKYDNNSMRIFIGQMSVMQPLMEKGDVQLVYSEFTEAWTAAEGVIHANNILDQNPDGITGIISGSDAISDGILQVLKERGLEGKVLFSGQDSEADNIKSLMDGLQTCDVLKPLKEMARITSEMAVSLALEKPLTMKFTTESNGKVLVKSILLEGNLVNKNNVESTVIASGFHTRAEISQ